MRVLGFRFFSVCVLLLLFGSLSLANNKVNCNNLGDAFSGEKTQEKSVRGFFKKFPIVFKKVVDAFKVFFSALTGRLTKTDPRLKTLVLDVGSLLQRTGKLPALIHFAGKMAYKAGLLPKSINETNLKKGLDTLVGIMEAELMERGYTSGTDGIAYEPWIRMGNRVDAEAKALADSFREKGDKSLLFSNPQFVSQFGKAIGVEFAPGTEVQLLVNGPASFEKRDVLIDKAKEKIYIGTWAWYDDITGKIYADKLIAKKKAEPSIDIRVTVDGQVAMDPEKQKYLNEMEEAGIQVLRWRSSNPQRKYDGYHKKVMIVDGNEAILGGMNFGDEYSHLGKADIPKWRDTDVLLKGLAARDAEKVFVEDWNAAVRNPAADFPTPQLTPARVTQVPVSLQPGMGQSAIVNHLAGGPENIYRTTILAIESAQKSIDIENAYILLDPGTLKALIHARKRGVRVRVLTNSKESVDVPEMAYTMMASANRLAAHGIEVYLKKGPTVHTKAMNVDGIFSWVGSHNIHGRSVRYEGEIIHASVDPNFGAKLTQMMEKDFAESRLLEKPEPQEPNAIGEIMGYWLFDQL